jgi:sulfoxide reductase heme-binding subunit YedZ
MKQMKRAAFALSLVPVAVGAYRAFLGDQFGANPVQGIEHFSGIWALRLLVLAIAITPLRLLTGWKELSAARRTFGLAAFWYAGLHMLSWAGLDLTFNPHDMWNDLLKRPYITIGMVAFVLLTALAATSPRSMVRRLGGARWQALHRLVFAAALLGCIHYEMVVKGFQLPPFYYGGIVVALVVWRIGRAVMRQRAANTVVGRVSAA